MISLATVLRHLIGSEVSPVPQFLRNVVETLAQEGSNVTS